MKIKINPDYLQDNEIINLRNTPGCKNLHNQVQIFDYKSPKSSSASSYKKQIILYAYMVGQSQGWTNEQIAENISCYIFFPFSTQKKDNTYDNMKSSVKRVNYTAQDIDTIISHDKAVVTEAKNIPWNTVDLDALGNYVEFSCSYCPFLGSVKNEENGFKGCKCSYDRGFRQSHSLRFNLRESTKSKTTKEATQVNEAK